MKDDKSLYFRKMQQDIAIKMGAATALGLNTRSLNLGTGDKYMQDMGQIDDGENGGFGTALFENFGGFWD